MSQLIALTTIGIGGVILVPALVFMGGVPIHRAIPAALLAYVMSGFTATAIFSRQKSIRWSMAAWLCLAAAPAAFAGALAVKNANARLLEMLIAAINTSAELSGVGQKDKLSDDCRKRVEARGK
ncbi:MAG: sulfite exporter TauE/SafE family protein [Bradyrhizobiaceae bacterium]|nr:sulfite exporter TauE/SafE family protein [Bradyrhizobiaceae bacterium]